MKKQSVITFNGITYDYFEDIKFYTMIGLLDNKTGMFQGVEITANTLKEMEHAKKNIDTLNLSIAAVVTGFIDTEIHYYATNMKNGVVSCTKLKPTGNGSLSGKVKTEIAESQFKTATLIQEVQDETLKASLNHLLTSKQNMLVGDKIQEANTSQKVKVLEA